MPRVFLLSALAVAIAAPMFAFAAGGWAVITVDDLPDFLVALEERELAFTVRAHGSQPLTGLRPTVELRSGTTATRVAAVASGAPGRYVARIRPAGEADWTITLRSGFGNSDLRLEPMPALGQVRLASQPSLSDADRGRRLFVAKGCATCHTHARAGRTAAVPAGPDLTEKHYDPAYLQMYLADPSIRPPSSPDGFRMPNVGLREHEIAALVAFVNQK